MSEREDNTGGEVNEPKTLEALDDAKFGWSTIFVMLPTISLIILSYFGMEFVRVNAGSFSRDVYVSNLREAPPVLGLPPELEKRIRGKKLYSANCAACHQENGVGVAGQFPPLKGSDWVLAAGADRIARLVLDGVGGPLTVNGTVYNNAMVPWRKTLNDEQISDILTYIRSNPAWGHSQTMVEEDFVAQIRAETADRTSPYTEAELLDVEISTPETAAN